MLKADLHIHSNYSDGTWYPEEIIKKLEKENVHVFSITDHDTIKASEETKEIMNNYSGEILFLPGVEISTTHDSREYHLTLYGYEKHNDLISLMKKNRQKRLNYNYDFIEIIANDYPQIAVWDYFNNYKCSSEKGGWKALHYFLEKGVCRSMWEYFSEIGNSGLELVFESPEEVIQICKKSSGKVFLAHPSYHYRENVMSEEELDFWRKTGIDGVECFSPYNKDTKQTGYYLDYCNRHNLLISGGSDSHGDFIKERKIGDPEIYFDMLRLGELI